MKNIIVLVGPSGSGKSTLEARMSKLGLSKIISHTSRNLRDGEVNGVDYHFVSKDYFLKNKNDFLEFVNVFGNFYGVHKNSLSSCTSVLVVEPGGLKQMLEYEKNHSDVNLITVYLHVSPSVQKKRMLDRGDTEEMVHDRLSQDQIAIDAKEIEFDFSFNTEIVSQELITNFLFSILNGEK